MYPYAMGVFHYTVQPYDSYWRLSQKFKTSIESIFSVNPGIDVHNLYVGQMICIPDLTHHPTSFQETRAADCISSAEAELKSSMRLLWEQHIAWTRMAIISLTFNLPDVSFVLARLLQNATDMGDSLRPFYGDVIANQYSSLIKEHLELAAALVKAAVAGNQQATAAAEKKWYANADEIALFWSRINPYLSKEAVRKMFYEHLALTKTEAVSMINKQYKNDIEAYDKIETQALEMADAFSNAIIKQFPL